MNERECLERMVAPGTRRPGKFREGVIQVHVTRACDKACFGCTQGSNLAGRVEFMSPEHFEQAVLSLRGYFGVVGVFGGNPAMSPHFREYCEVLRRLVPFEQRGLWCNNPRSAEYAHAMRETFNPRVSNLNCHLDAEAYTLFKVHWPESMPFGLHDDCRHSPPFVAMKDVLTRKCECVDKIVKNWNDAWAAGDMARVRELEAAGSVPCDKCKGTRKVYDEERAWELISGCDINQHWSAMIGVFRGQLRAWFCEVAGAQAILHQDEPDYPDTGLDPMRKYEFRYDPRPLEEQIHSDPGEAVVDCDMHHVPWWQLGMGAFRSQVRKHCHECGVPLRGYGELAQSGTGTEQVSATHAAVYRPKRKGRPVQVVTSLEQLGVGKLRTMTHYMQNARV